MLDNHLIIPADYLIYDIRIAANSLIVFT